MTLRLRAHHLLCLLTYAGQGYSPAFCDNLGRIAGRLGRGEDILVVAGPDEVCAPLLDTHEPHCLRARVTRRDQRAAAALTDLLGRRVAPGARLALDRATLAGMREAFAAGTIRAGCTGCAWSELCTEVASADFAGTKLLPPS